MVNRQALRGMKVKRRYVRTTDDRVGHVARNIQRGRASGKVHAFAAMALTDYCDGDWCVQPRDWLGEVCALADHVKRNVRYTLDTYGIDTYRTPDRTLDLAMGDCDDMTALAGAALQAVGYPVRIKVIQMRGQDSFHHIYLLAGLPPANPTRWLAVDPTQPFGCGWEPEGIVREKVYKIK